MARAATPARQLALNVTRAVRLRDAYVRELVDSQRERCGLPQEEFAFAQVLAFGVCMCRGTLDELVDRNLNSRKDIKPKVRDALRISAYELLFLEKPEHVVVSQGVELVRSVAPKAAGLANAVLRKMARDARHFPWGDPDADTAAFARSYGVPVWLAQRLGEQYGHTRARDVLAASLKAAPTYLCNDVFAPGEQFASDLSAQHVASLVSVDGDVLEIGAGRGTKTMLLQSAAMETCGAPARIHAVELHEYRVALLKERLARAGVPGVVAHVGDARNLDAIEGLPGAFDCVLVDAPCSGTGTLRRHPEIRWRLAPSDVDGLAKLQLELLREAARRVKRGGALVYATCSVLAQENEQVVEAFLESEQGRDFAVERMAPLTDEQRRAAPGWSITRQGYFASVPTDGGPDGHFAARFARVAKCARDV